MAKLRTKLWNWVKANWTGWVKQIIATALPFLVRLGLQSFAKRASQKSSDGLTSQESSNKIPPDKEHEDDC